MLSIVYFPIISYLTRDTYQ